MRKCPQKCPLRHLNPLSKIKGVKLKKKLKDKGDIIDIKAETPILHSGEDTRWDFKVTITFKTEHLALDYSIVDPYKKELFPDKDAYVKAEQQRFELVLAHWDVPVETLPLN